MKKILIIFIIWQISSNIFAEETGLEKKYQPLIQKIVSAFASGNKEEIANFIAYPFNKQNIKNKTDMINRFEEIFDKNLISIIAKSSIKKDWGTVGWRGIMLNSGLVWVNYDGKIIAVNYQTKLADKVNNSLYQKDKKNLHASLKAFKKNILKAETKKFKIRIDELSNGMYRYASWSKEKTQSQKPSLILKNGKIFYEGTGGNHHYDFYAGKHIYRVYRFILGYAKSAIGELEVSKNSKTILKQEFIKYYGVKKNTVKNKIIDFLKNSYLKKAIAANLLGEENRKFRFYQIDLNGDGKKEIFIKFFTPYFCTTKGCTLLLLDNGDNNQIKIITEFSNSFTPIFAGKWKINGWKGLLMQFDGGEHKKLVYSNGTYPKNPSLLPNTSYAPSGHDEYFFSDYEFTEPTVDQEKITF